MMLTDSHSKLGIKRSALRNCSTYHRSTQEFIKSGMEFMSSGAKKSSLQSNVGAISRRVKLRSECMQIQPSGLLCCVTRTGLNPIVSDDVIVSLNKDFSYWFGNPCIRAISKLASGVMQSRGRWPPWSR